MAAAPMMGIAGLQQTTNYRVVLPFYVYAALSFLGACLLLLFNTHIVDYHYFNPHTLAITHFMALGWGTMIVLGASHQLLPVLVEGKLDSDALAYSTFAFTATGIPFLIVGFYIFHTGWVLQLGAILVNIGVVLYVLNVFLSSFKSKVRSVHAWYMIAASLWLFSTTFFGLLLVINFNRPILPQASVNYLAIHAHLGLVGWFLLMVLGVGTRLIPMFLISKYTNTRMLRIIFVLVNLGLISFIVFKLWNVPLPYYYLSIALVLAGIVLFARHCYKAYKVRIRRNVDEQMKTSLLSVAQMLLPFVALLLALALLPAESHPNIVLLYGFCILFGWITAIILGMTFKTLPFIVWNKVFKKMAKGTRTPAPKELFSEKIYNTMLLAYLGGFLLFIAGIITMQQAVLIAGASALVIAAALYAYNSIKTLFYQPKKPNV